VTGSSLPWRPWSGRSACWRAPSIGSPTLGRQLLRLIPQAVVHPKDVAEIQALFLLSHERRVPITFRAAGTSISGQAVSDGLLLDISRHWRAVHVLDGGRRVRVQPGVIAAHVNARLKSYATKIGPDRRRSAPA
jgi:FAD/FMN-containing dehydrogenase